MTDPGMWSRKLLTCCVAHATLCRPALDRSKMEALFNKYKDDGDDSMSIQGVLSLAGDLGLEMTDIRVTILLAFVNFVKLTSTKTDFLKGLSELRCDSISAVGSKLTKLEVDMVRDDALFKRVFEYSYVGNLEVRAIQRKHATPISPISPLCVFAAWPEGPQAGDRLHAAPSSAGQPLGAHRRLCGVSEQHGTGPREQRHMEDSGALHEGAAQFRCPGRV